MHSNHQYEQSFFRRNKEREIAAENLHLRPGYSFTVRAGIDVDSQRVIMLKLRGRDQEIVGAKAIGEVNAASTNHVLSDVEKVFLNFQRKQRGTSAIDEFCMQRWRVNQKKEGKLVADLSNAQ